MAIKEAVSFNPLKSFATTVKLQDNVESTTPDGYVCHVYHEGEFITEATYLGGGRPLQYRQTVKERFLLMVSSFDLLAPEPDAKGELMTLDDNYVIRALCDAEKIKKDIEAKSRDSICFGVVGSKFPDFYSVKCTEDQLARGKSHLNKTFGRSGWFMLGNPVSGSVLRADHYANKWGKPVNLSALEAA